MAVTSDTPLRPVYAHSNDGRARSVVDPHPPVLLFPRTVGI